MTDEKEDLDKYRILTSDLSPDFVKKYKLEKGEEIAKTVAEVNFRIIKIEQILDKFKRIKRVIDGCLSCNKCGSTNFRRVKCPSDKKEFCVLEDAHCIDCGNHIHGFGQTIRIISDILNEAD